MVRTKTYLAALERHAQEVRALHADFSAERAYLLDRIMLLADKPMYQDAGFSEPEQPDDGDFVFGDSNLLSEAFQD